MSRMMIVSAAFLALTFNGFAEDKAEDGTKFEEVKSKVLENMNARITALQEAKSCIEGASDKGAMKECRKALRDKMKSMKKDHKKHGRGKGKGHKKD